MTTTKSSLFLLGFILLTLFYYWIFSYIDYSFAFLSLIRIGTMIIGFVYFYFLNKYVFKQKAILLIGQLVMIIHMVLTIEASDAVNDTLLSSHHAETIAIVKEYKRSRGSEYCILGYTVNNRYYEKSVLNEAPEYRYRNKDSMVMEYYISNPAISAVK